MTKVQDKFSKKRLQEQIALIERACAATGKDYEGLADAVAVKPDTMRKYAGGYQPAGDGVMTLLRRLVESPSKADHGPASAVVREEAPGHYHAGAKKNDETTASAPGSQKTVAQLFSYVLTNGNFADLTVMRGVLDATCEAILNRLRQAAERASEPDSVVHIARDRVLKPLLGAVPAGHPHEAIEQTEEFVSVPKRQSKDVDYALRVRGESMSGRGLHDGDIVLLSLKREPRNGAMVAALYDDTEVTLKTLVEKGDERWLKSENPNFPPKIVPRSGLRVQGVVVGKLQS